jgi:hypothetical protein
VSERFLGAITAGRRKRVGLNDLRRIWLDANPHLLQHPERDSLLLLELQRLAGEKLVTLPSVRSFERVGRPPMPLFITLVDSRDSGPERAAWPESWLPQLGFWPTLCKSELETARAINEWLKVRQGDFIAVPLRERSLEIFGDEKYLDMRVRYDALFSGRLSLSSIGAFTVAPPLPHRVGTRGHPVVIVENHHTYWSLANWNESAERYAAVVYGAGHAVSSTGRALKEVLRETGGTRALYFGDIDPTGIEIALRMNRLEEGLVSPDLALYELALRQGRRTPGVNRRYSDATALERWLPSLAAEIVQIWNDGFRIPQENVGTELLWHWHECTPQ